jgi:hypothetical protein
MNVQMNVQMNAQLTFARVEGVLDDARMIFAHKLFAQKGPHLAASAS